MISYYRLRELLSYDAEEGVFRWAVSHGFKKRGVIAGDRGRITADGKTYPAGKLAWFYTYCRWPGKNFHHIDGDKLNIALSNLSNEAKGRAIAKRLTDHWVRMTRTEDGYKLEITEKYKAPVDLGTYPTYEQAAEVQRMALSCWE